MSDFTFRPVLENVLSDFEAIQRWESDPLIVELTRPSFIKGAPVGAEERRQQYLNGKERANGERMIMLMNGERPVGQMTLNMDPSHLFLKEAGSAWIGLTIGERDQWGKGLGLLALQHLEKVCWDVGAVRIELGVFGFNERARALYAKAGYGEIGIIPRFTFARGRWWDDVRMEKRPSKN